MENAKPTTSATRSESSADEGRDEPIDPIRPFIEAMLTQVFRKIKKHSPTADDDMTTLYLEQRYRLILNERESICKQYRSYLGDMDDVNEEEETKMLDRLEDYFSYCDRCEDAPANMYIHFLYGDKDELDKLRIHDSDHGPSEEPTSEEDEVGSKNSKKVEEKKME